MDNLYCNGNETRLDKCQFDGWKTHDCVSNEAAGVICKPNQQLANYVTHYNQQLIASNAPEQRVNIINMNQPVPKRNHQLQVSLFTGKDQQLTRNDDKAKFSLIIMKQKGK